MLVSLIYTACNQGDWVRKTLPQAVESLNGTPHETIIIDDQSIDGCCHRLGKDCLVVRPERRLGVSAARRLGAKIAQGDVLLFSDPHCEYPDHALQRLTQLADVNWGIFQPPTKSRPQSSRIAYGGRLENSDRGVVVHTSQPRARQWPALINTIYVLRREVYESMGGWPELPGCWGYSEQAMTLLAWACRIPIVVADTSPCVHYAYQVDRRLPYFIGTRERADNAHIVHAAFFPKKYEELFGRLLSERFGVDGKEALASKCFANLQEQLQHSANVAEEEELLQHVDGMDWTFPGQGQPDVALIEQQRKRALEMGSASARPRLSRNLEWFISQIPGCIKGRAVLDVGAHDGLMCQYLIQRQARRVQGIELIPEMVEQARKRGRPVFQGDMRQLPDDPRWDLVTCLHTLEHLPDPLVGLQGLARVLRPGGWLLLVVPRESSPQPDRAHNCCFPDSRCLKNLVKQVDAFNHDSIRTKVTKYAADEMEIRLAVRKK